MSTMAISARWEFDLRIGKGKGASQELPKKRRIFHARHFPNQGK